MRSNVNKNILDAIVCNKSEKAKCLFSMREKRGIDSFLNGLRKAINKQANGIISDIRFQNHITSLKILSSFDRNLYIHLRIFQDNVILLLPSELVFLFSRNLTKEDEQPILNEISIKEATALSFFIVSMLAKEEIFRSQRVYLAGVNSSDNKRIKEELAEKIDLDNSEILEFEIKSKSEDFKIVSLISSKVFQRIKSYLRLTVEKEFLNQNINLHFNLEFSLNSLSLGSLFSLKKGNQIDLQRADAAWNLRLISKEENKLNSKMPLKCVSTKGKRGLQFKLC